MSRYAIYAVPAAGHALWTAAADWLGRDAETGVEALGIVPAWLDRSNWLEITASPRRYGFHGTLKPPFALATGIGADDLRGAFRDFAAEMPPLPPVRCEIAALAGFVAVVPREPTPSLYRLADRSIVEFDRFRMPPGAAELARRRAAGLTPAQEQHLQRWGYPYVFDQFRFHMTLTGRLDPAERTRLRPWLADRFAPVVAQPIPMDLALFYESGDGRPFQLIQRCALT